MKIIFYTKIILEREGEVTLKKLVVKGSTVTLTLTTKKKSKRVNHS
jgi:hypothetical protein